MTFYIIILSLRYPKPRMTHCFECSTKYINVFYRDVGLHKLIGQMKGVMTCSLVQLESQHYCVNYIQLNRIFNIFYQFLYSLLVFRCQYICSRFRSKLVQCCNFVSSKIYFANFHKVYNNNKPQPMSLSYQELVDGPCPAI